MTTKPVENLERKESLLTFPTDFPLKIMGVNQDGFLDAIADLLKVHAPDFDPVTIGQNFSSGGNYMSLTATITATSQEQLDDLYRALTSHPMVKIVL